MINWPTAIVIIVVIIFVYAYAYYRMKYHYQFKRAKLGDPTMDREDVLNASVEDEDEDD